MKIKIQNFITHPRGSTNHDKIQTFNLKVLNYNQTFSVKLGALDDPFLFVFFDPCRNASLRVPKIEFLQKRVQCRTNCCCFFSLFALIVSRFLFFPQKLISLGFRTSRCLLTFQVVSNFFHTLIVVHRVHCSEKHGLPVPFETSSSWDQSTFRFSKNSLTFPM